VAKRAKRAERPNPREDRNTQGGGPRPPRRNFRGGGGVGVPGGESGFTSTFPTAPKKTRVEIIPRNLQQENMVAALNDENINIVFAVGPAGCGKTLLATMHAIKMLKTGQVERIVITRPNVAVDDKDIGYLPGDILKKMTPWMMPVLDVFAEYYTQDQIRYMLEENVIEMVPIAFIRGRTFKNAIVLVDEAQGTTQNSMMSILTRIGEGSKMIVTGDLAQSDRGQENGLRDFLTRFEDSEHIEVIQFKRGDVERHPVVKEVLDIYKDLPQAGY
jgi:phosphate starvation-inducible PhoH-like protein